MASFKDDQNCRSLEEANNQLEGMDKLKHPPKVLNEEVGEEIVRTLQQTKLVPTLFFVDPWGYKGLSLRLVKSVLKDWGCDCIFFFNYNRISMGLGNPLVREHMDALFGQPRADQLRQRLEPLEVQARELCIVEELGNALVELGGKYVLPFRFRNKDGTRTSHHLIFVSKHLKGYEIMKEIMARESSSAEQGVPSFEYTPAAPDYPFLFELSRPLDDLGDMLLSDFAGRSLTMREVYQEHNVGRRYIKANYKEVLKKLEEAGRINADPPAKRRRKDTFGDDVRVTFLGHGER